MGHVESTGQRVTIIGDAIRVWDLEGDRS